MRLRLIVFISIIQTILFLGHWLVYVTWARLFGGIAASGPMKLTLAVLSVSFVLSSLHAWRSDHLLARAFYTVAAAWLGFASNFMWAAVLCWMVYGVVRVLGLGWTPLKIAAVLFGAALLAGIYGILNAAWLRVTRISVALPNLPGQWRGRTAALVSDTHLGPVRNGRFIRRVVDKLAALQPDIVFLAGDLYDGAAADFEKLAEPWKRLTSVPAGVPVLHANPGPEASAPLGVYYIAGNHEEFYRHAEYHVPLIAAGVRELNNQKVEVDGLQVVGVHYSDAAHPERYRSILSQAALDRARASVLLLHAPVNMAVAEAEGISLQLSGHTHGGQFFPYTWITRRVWGKFVHGLERWGSLQVYTNYGAGTWGPPMRVGTFPEIVMISFE